VHLCGHHVAFFLIGKGRCFIFALFEYFRNITYYLLFAAVVGMIAPAGKYRQYVRLVTGFILLLLILQPLTVFINGPGLPVTEWFSVSAAKADDYRSSYDEWHYTSLSAAFEEQLHAQLSAFLQQNGYEMGDAEFAYANDFSRIERISLTASNIPSEPGRRPFIRIEPVQIGSGKAETEGADTAAIKKLISGFYNLPAEHIHVIIRDE
jgi:stage III sporulation protein AF